MVGVLKSGLLELLFVISEAVCLTKSVEWAGEKIEDEEQ